MKITLTVLLTLLALVAVQMTRWQIVVAGNAGLIVYRLDRLTGRVEMSMADHVWRPIHPPHVNEWGDEAVE